MASAIGSRAFCFSDGGAIFHTYIIGVGSHCSGRSVAALDSVGMLLLAPLRETLHCSDVRGRVYILLCLLVTCFFTYFAEIKWILSPYYVILLFLIFRCEGADTVAVFLIN